MTQTVPFLLALMTQNFNLPVGLLSAVCYVESGHNPSAMHKDDGKGNSVGICQIKLNTARTLGFKGTENQLKLPEINIFYSAKYLSKQLTRYRGVIYKAISAYNAGAFRYNERGEISNKRYVFKVLRSWEKGL